MTDKEILRKARVFREFQDTEVYKELADSVLRQDALLLRQLGSLREPDPQKLAELHAEIRGQRRGINWCLDHIELVRRAKLEVDKRELNKKKKEKEENVRKRLIDRRTQQISGRTKIRPRVAEKRA